METLHLAKHHLVAIKVAENNGRMLDVLKGVAKQMIVSEQTKKKANQIAYLSCHANFIFY
ncbi:hypothetical protein OL548_26965 [Lysinibacillus sp. MHQ-1]|nr:hypothetical protein OL548_26965 [Lysinibacillus sp. MHQ-1]